MGKTGRPRVPGSGRKPKYTSAEQVQTLIDGYFTRCRGTILRDPDTQQPVFDKYGQPVIIDAMPPTVTGLALALGFTNRMDLLRYQGKKEFTEVITKAKLQVEAYAEARLFDRDGANGARFSLDCNFNWGKRDEEKDATPTVKIVYDIPRVQVESADGATQTEDAAGVKDDGTSDS